MIPVTNIPTRLWPICAIELKKTHSARAIDDNDGRDIDNNPYVSSGSIARMLKYNSTGREVLCDKNGRGCPPSLVVFVIITDMNSKDAAKKDRSRFGGNRETIYKRDGYKCVKCNMTMDTHLLKYGKRLTINHINGLGRNVKVPDNDLSNLETLCLPCHGKADGGRWMFQPITQTKIL